MKRHPYAVFSDFPGRNVVHSAKPDALQFYHIISDILKKPDFTEKYRVRCLECRSMEG